MDFPRWLMPALIAGFIGAGAGMAALKYGFGYVSAQDAHMMAEQRSHDDVLKLGAATCAEKFRSRAGTELDERLRELKAATSVARGEILVRLGAIILQPKQKFADFDLARACSDLVLAEQ